MSGSRIASVSMWQGAGARCGLPEPGYRCIPARPRPALEPLQRQAHDDDTIFRNLSVAIGFTLRYIACDESDWPVAQASVRVGHLPALSGLLSAPPRGRFAGLAPRREP